MSESGCGSLKPSTQTRGTNIILTPRNVYSSTSGPSLLDLLNESTYYPMAGLVDKKEHSSLSLVARDVNHLALERLVCKQSSVGQHTTDVPSLSSGPALGELVESHHTTTGSNAVLSSGPTLGELVQSHCATTGSNAALSSGPTLGELVQSHCATTDSNAALSSGPTLGELVQSHCATTGSNAALSSGPTLGELVQSHRATTDSNAALSSGPTLGELVQSHRTTTGSNAALSSGPTLGELVQSNRATTGSNAALSSGPTLGELVQSHHTTTGSNAALSSGPTLGELVQSHRVTTDSNAALSSGPTLGELVQSRHTTTGSTSALSSGPTLGELVQSHRATTGSNAALSSGPTLGELVQSHRATTDSNAALSSQPTLGEMASQTTFPSFKPNSQFNSSKEQLPSLTELLHNHKHFGVKEPTISPLVLTNQTSLDDLIQHHIMTKQPTAVASNNSCSLIRAKVQPPPGFNNFKISNTVTAEQSLLDRSTGIVSQQPSLADLVAQQSSPFVKQPSLADLVTLSKTNAHTTQPESQSLATLSSLMSRSLSIQPQANLVKDVAIPTNENQHSFSDSHHKVTVSNDKRSLSMISVVLIRKSCVDTKVLKIIEKRKSKVFRKIANSYFSSPRFNFSTPSPDDHVTSKQQKGFKQQ